MAVAVAHHLLRLTPAFNKFPRYTVDGDSSFSDYVTRLYICDMYLKIEVSSHPWFLDAIAAVP